jgi:hypothetical protein
MFQGTPWRGYRHLWTEYLPDANPIQIVTSAHVKNRPRPGRLGPPTAR